MSNIRRALFVVLISLSTIAMAQGDRGQGPQWVLDQSGYYCALAAKLTSPVPATFVLRTLPGTWTVDVLLIGEQRIDKLAHAHDNIALRFLPGGAVQSRTPDAALAEGNKTILLRGLPAEVMHDFATSSAIELDADNKAATTYVLPPTASAAASLDRCVADQLIEAGADPAGFEPGATPPKPIGDLYKWVALPMSNVRILALLDVDSGGKATNCQMMESSGVSDTQKICRSLLDRARYDPARDPKGHPIKSIVVYDLDVIVRDTITTKSI